MIVKSLFFLFLYRKLADMKKIIISLLLALPILLQAQLIKTLKKTIELQMPGIAHPSKLTGKDSLPGKRGAAVAWHPLQKKYYAAFAGNTTFPLAVFDISGKHLSSDDLMTMEDLRGLWYNPKLKKLCGNAYSDYGWFSYILDSNGIPVKIEVYAEGMNQPDKQSIGTYNEKSNLVCFLNGTKIEMYNAEAMMEEDSTIQLYPGISRKEDIIESNDETYFNEYYNFNVLIYTGISKAEFGLLNINDKQVELYNRKTGLLTQKLKLPADVETYNSFNFSYANGIFWSFNMDTRIWTGYK
jgi:hypothetical protein